ncbi:MAG: ZIP family metal transporter [Candidatus Aminicenantes bacterium]|nr:ZIP family metal transporter [Candidatus Aminicenantes bacterium]
MPDAFASLSPVLQALIATLFTWGLTALGAGLVFFFKDFPKRALDGMLGFAAGVMIAASFWSLLAPAIALAEAQGVTPWLPAAGGFLLGGAFLKAVDKLLPHLHSGFEKPEGLRTSWKRTVLLVMAITLHNIPEGLAVGVAFGAAALGGGEATLGAAVALAVGIGLQNFPEGTAVSVPLRREGLSRSKSFFYGQISGMVEPLAGVLGAAAVFKARPLLPWALAFAAGAMIYVVVEEVIPESQLSGDTDTATLGAMAGFALMMILDVALG